MSNRSKDETRDKIREILINRVVCSNYGNYQTYKILDISFDE